MAKCWISHFYDESIFSVGPKHLCERSIVSVAHIYIKPICNHYIPTLSNKNIPFWSQAQKWVDKRTTPINQLYGKCLYVSMHCSVRHMVLKPIPQLEPTLKKSCIVSTSFFDTCGGAPKLGKRMTSLEHHPCPL